MIMTIMLFPDLCPEQTRSNYNEIWITLILGHSKWWNHSSYLAKRIVFLTCAFYRACIIYHNMFKSSSTTILPTTDLLEHFPLLGVIFKLPRRDTRTRSYIGKVKLLGNEIKVNKIVCVEDCCLFTFFHISRKTLALFL